MYKWNILYCQQEEKFRKKWRMPSLFLHLKYQRVSGSHIQKRDKFLHIQDTPWDYQTVKPLECSTLTILSAVCVGRIQFLNVPPTTWRSLPLCRRWTGHQWKTKMKNLWLSQIWGQGQLEEEWGGRSLVRDPHFGKNYRACNCTWIHHHDVMEKN